MFKSVAKGLGRWALLLVSMALLTGASLFIVGSYLVTWPILRKSPRDQRIETAINLASATMATFATWNKAESNEHTPST